MTSGSRRSAVRPAVLALVSLLVACSGGEPGEASDEPASGDRSPETRPGNPPAHPGGPGTYVYACPDGYAFAVDVGGDSATVELVAREETLPRVPAPSGTRYEAGDLVFWIRGAEATLEVGSGQHRECRGEQATSPWDKARLLGIELRALGQEPGWIVDVHPARWIRYIGDYGETRVAFPAASPQGDSASITYSTETAGHSLTVVFRRIPCRDAMSGQPFAFTVSLRVDGRQLEGCGRRLQEP